MFLLVVWYKYHDVFRKLLLIILCFKQGFCLAELITILSEL